MPPSKTEVPNRLLGHAHNWFLSQLAFIYMRPGHRIPRGNTVTE